MKSYPLSRTFYQFTSAFFLLVALVGLPPGVAAQTGAADAKPQSALNSDPVTDSDARARAVARAAESRAAHGFGQPAPAL
jgi:hypothetical protein